METPNSHEEGETMTTWQHNHVTQLNKVNLMVNDIVEVLDTMSQSNSMGGVLDKMTHDMLKILGENHKDNITRVKRLESLVGDMALRITELEQINHRLHGEELAEDLPY